jgi:hypothetical protein
VARAHEPDVGGPAGNRISNTAGDGIDLSAGGLYRDNVVEASGLAGSGVSVLGGTALGRQPL